MAIVQTQCTIFKQNCLSGLENFAVGTPYVYKLALYTADASLDATTVAYSTTGEVVGSGYTAGGQAMVVIPPASNGSTAYISFVNPVWTSASFVTRGALIYNSTKGNKAIAVLDFGSDKTTVIEFTITLPPDEPTSAVIRIT
jgi:hypothetical protein